MAIAKCTCENEYQDKLYGKGMRVHNAFGGRGADRGRCTVCGNSNSIPKEKTR